MNNVICFSRISRPRATLFSSAPSGCALVWATPQMKKHMYFPAFIKKLEPEALFRSEPPTPAQETAYARALDYLSSLKNETDLWEAL